MGFQPGDKVIFTDGRFAGHIGGILKTHQQGGVTVLLKKHPFPIYVAMPERVLKKWD